MKRVFSKLCVTTLVLSSVLMATTAYSAGHSKNKPVTIGILTTLSTAGGYLGRDMRDAFMLAIKEEGGTLGGAPVKIIQADDEHIFVSIVTDDLASSLVECIVLPGCIKEVFVTFCTSE